MLRFLLVHLLEDGAAAQVLLRQAFEVAFEVFADLPFRLGDEAETPAIAERATGGPDRKRACIPERAEPARRRIEFGQALFAPRQVIEFLVGAARCICCSIDLSLATTAWPW